MSQGSWVEFTADLTDYTNVYVRVYYSGSTAIRNIDDLTLTTVEPSYDPSITAADVNIAYDAEEGTINYTINNPVEGGSIVASTEAEWLMVDDEAQTDAEGSIYFYCGANSNFYAHSATVTLTYTYGDSKATVTKEVTVTQAKDPNANGSTAEYPITVSEALEAIDEVETVSDIYVGGIVSAIVDEYSSTYHNITFDMIDEEGNEYFLRAYRCVGTDGVNASEVAVGDYVIVKGDLKLYTSSNSSIYELGQGCQLVSLIHPAVPSITVNPDVVELDAEEHDGTLDLTYESLTITDMTDFDIQFCDANGDELSEEPDWIDVLVAEQDPTIGEGYVVSYYMVENEGTDARTAYFKVYAMDDETNLVYSNLVTISQATPVAPATGDEYALYTGELVEGDYLIVYNGYAMKNTVESSRLSYEEVEPFNNVITTDNASIVWHIAPSGDYWTIYSAEVDAYAASTGSKNQAQMLASGTDDKALWTVTGTETFEFENKARAAATSNPNNKWLRNNGTNGFACYATATGGALSLYKKVETYTLEIAGYGNDDEVTTGWYLISSPIGKVAPTAVTNMTSNKYDLYLFDQKGDLKGNEWINYEDEQNGGGFDLEPGKGYLYANSGNVNLTFTGVPYNQTGTFDLDYYTTNSDYNMHGWNLVGNPFPSNATVSKPFHKINSTSDGINYTPVGAGGVIGKMEGAFVQATTTGQQVTFTQTDSEPSEIRGINIDVIRNGEFLDRAIVSFTTNGSLSKLVLSDNTTKVYFRQEEKDYAIIASPSENEMPVNFKASRNGNYTLTVNAEDLEMNYLHLIDNMTGNDVDLLQTPSYSFDAKTTDYKSRFKLVFSANGIEENAATTAFAFFNGSEWTINNDGQATLQLIDLTGRTISHEVINGNVSKAINAAPGIYMLRLVSDNEVKNQKIVVK